MSGLTPVPVPASILEGNALHWYSTLNGGCPCGRLPLGSTPEQFAAHFKAVTQ